MSIILPLSQQTEDLLRRRAAACGLTPEAFAQEAVEQRLRFPESLQELLAPIHEETQRRGLTETQLGDLIEGARDEAFSANAKKRSA